jgi:HlyD family secretion protein
MTAQSANKKKWIVIAGIAAIVVIPLSIKLLRNDNSKKVEIERVALHELTPTILASGSLTYESQVTLTPEIAGRVKQILVNEGDIVKDGQMLLRLDPEASLAEIAQIEAAMRQSTLNIERQQVTLDAQITKWRRFEALRKQGLIDANAYDDLVSQKDLAEVQLRSTREDYKQNEARLAQAKERLGKTEIRSPLAGKVTAIFIKAGETAIPSATSIAGSTLLQVADTTSVYAEVNIDETDIARVKVGAEAKIVPAAFPDKSLKGTVDQVAIWPRQSGNQNKSYPVKIRLANDDAITFHPGMSCRAEVSTRAASGQRMVAVPVQAVKYEEADKKTDKAKTSVFIVKDGRVTKRDVETGTADDSYIEIMRGLQADEQVVIGPAKTLHFLRDGERVAAVEASATTNNVASEPKKGAVKVQVNQ